MHDQSAPDAGYAKRLFEILYKVVDDYICLIDVDLSTGRELQFMLHDNGGEFNLPKWSEADDYPTCIVDYANMIVVPEDRDRFIEMTRIERMLSVLTAQKEFVILYDALIDGSRRHFQGRFTLSGNKDEPHMYVGIRDITETRKYENRSLEMSDVERHSHTFGTCSMQKRVVLIIDDDAFERDNLRSILSSDYHVLCAANGQEGLAVLQSEYRFVSVIILDLHMPVMDGYTFLNLIGNDKLLCNIPIVVATWSNNGDDEIKCLKSGAADFIKKPCDAEKLRVKVANIIKLHESNATLFAVEFDEMTGLYTRQAFFHHAENILWQYPKDNFTLLVSDVVGFKSINRRYGTRTGDQVLMTFANYLKKLTDSHDAIICRLDTDHFAGIIRTKHAEAQLDQIALAINSINENMPIPNVETKFGIYDHIDHSIPIQLSCDRALMAIMDIKHQYGKHYAFYNEDIQNRADRQRMIEAGMKDALEQGQFLVYYQPKHDTASGALIGAEALLRWQHPVFGYMSPAEFIPIFEQTGFITNADMYVWNRTCANLRKWLNSGLRTVPISVNFSRKDFADPLLTDNLENARRSCSIPAHYLHIEVTESVFADNSKNVINSLNTLRKTGHMIELDDFGSGYSSLNALSELPADVIKFDMSFMRQSDNPRRIKVLSSCSGLARSMHLVTLVEGVETEAQLKIAKDCGIDIIQGYYYSKPLCEEDFERYIAMHSASDKCAYNPIHTSLPEIIPDDASVPVYRTLGSEFDSIYEVDLFRNSIVAFKLAKDTPAPIEVLKPESYIAFMQTCIDNAVSEGAQKLKVLTDLPALIELLHLNPSIRFRFASNTGQYHLLRVFRMEPFDDCHKAVIAISKE